MLDSVKDAKVDVEIPLKAGTYRVQGHKVTVPPGAKMRVQMEVQDGRLVPSRDTRGNDTGRGTKVELDPPLDLPAWVTGKGAYVEDKGKGQGQVKADIGGWFDQNVGKKTDLGLGSVVKAFSDGSAAKPADKKEKSPFPADMVEFDKMKFTAGDVTFKGGAMHAGSVKLDLAEGNKLSIQGDGKNATVRGDVKVNSLGVNQDGFSMKSGPGTATLEARYSRAPDGTASVKASVSSLHATLEGAEATKPRFPGDTDPDRISLGQTVVRNGSLEVGVKMRQQDGKVAGSLVDSQTRVHMDGAGTLKEAKLTVKDARDDAQVRLNGGRFQGTLDIGPGGSKMDLSVKNTQVDLRDLQAQDQRGALDVHHASAQGDARVQVNTADQSYDVQVAGKNIDVRVDDFRGSFPGTQVDLASSSLSGSGNLRVSNQGGVEVAGNLKVKGGFDDLKVADGKGGNLVDVAPGSTFDATVKSFRAGTSQGLAMDASGKVDLGLEGYRADLPGMSASGNARVAGTADLKVGEGSVSLTNADAKVSVNVDDAKVAPGGQGFSLDVAQGSKLDLNVREMKFATSSGVQSLKLGAGSKLDAQLDGGHVTAGDQTIQFEKGTRAQFQVDGLSHGKGSVPELKGRLSVDLAAKTVGFPDQETTLAPGVTVDNIPGVRGRARLTVDDVTMRGDGTFSLKGVNVGVDAKVGTVTGHDAGTASPAGSLRPHAPAATPDIKAPVAGPTSSPDGTLSEAQVKQTTAAAMAGASTAGRAQQVQPLEMAKRIQNGTLHLEIPMEGKVGSGLKGVTFAKGTTLKVDAKVVDGKVVPSETKATLTKPGDAALWVGVRGVYFDKKNTLRADLSGFPDFAVSDKCKEMPLDVDKFVDRLAGTGGGGASSTAGGTDVLKVDQARFSIKDAAFKPGRMAVPGGHVDISASTRLSLSGTPQAATLSGRVDLNGVDVAQDGVALKTGRGTADLKVDYRADATGATVSTSLSNMSLATQYAVQKRANGDYVHLATGHIRDGSLSMTTRLSNDERGLPTKPGATDVKLDIPSFDGTMEGGRVTVKDADGTAQVELGRARVFGSVHVDKDQVAVRGDVQELDVAVRDFAAQSGSGSVAVDYARVQGSGKVDLSTHGGLKVEADVKAVDVRARDIKGTTSVASVDAGQTLVQGRGKLTFSSSGELAIQGDLKVQTTLDEARLASGQGGTQGRAKVGEGSTLLGNVSEFAFNKDGMLRIKGQGMVDVKVEGFSGSAPMGSATGDARIRGGGAFVVDTSKGIDLPNGLDAQVRLDDAKIGKPGDAVYLDVAKGSSLSIRGAEVDLKDGRPTRLDLGRETTLQGKLDGGQVRIPGLAQPLQVGAGSAFTFAASKAITDGQKTAAVEGRLSLDATVDAATLDLAALSAGGFTVERLDNARARVRVNVDRVKVREDGTFELGEASVVVDAQLGELSGTYRPGR
jgi:hypothetical protein